MPKRLPTFGLRAALSLGAGLLLALAAFGGVELLAGGGAASAQAPAPEAAPPAVTVAVVEKKNIAPAQTEIGRVQAIQSVQIHAMVEGMLEQVAFQEGSDVKQGQLLFVIQPATYDAQLKEAEAALAKAKATLSNDQLTVDRDQILAAKGDTPRSTLDLAVATRDADKASVEAAQGQVQVAKVNVGYTRIEAPISGRIGAAAITKGNLVGPTTGTLATLVQLDPIRVVYSADQRTLVAAERRTDSTAHEITDQLTPRIQFSDGSMYAEPGQLEFIGNEVDPTTGTVPIYAKFPNPKKLLLPGEYVKVIVRPSEPEERLLAPVTAVQQNKSGKFVLLVGANDKVEQRSIKADQQIGADWVVESGLEPGDRVIVAGLQKVHAGQVVNPQPKPQQNAADAAAEPKVQ